MKPPMITAHSGCDGTKPNSLKCVTYALASGADALEVDVRMTQDGVLVLSHDEKKEYAGCPSLEEVFSLLDAVPEIKINCDLKETGLEAAVVSLADGFSTLKGRLIFTGSVKTENLSPDILSKARPFLNIEEYIPSFYDRMRDMPGFDITAAEQIVKVLRHSGVTGVNLYYPACTPGFLMKMQQNNIDVSVWTVDDIEQARKLAALGVFNLTTRNAAKMLLEFKK